VYAQYVNLDAGLLARVPDQLSLAKAPTVPLAGLTASQLLDQALADEARTLLIDGPLGAVGRSLVALATRAGGEVIGVSRPEQADQLRSLGASSTVERGPFTGAVRRRYPGGVDAAIDLVGGATAHNALDAVRGGGRYATAVPARRRR
jgi:NADPH:quinone reductase-like Zn-dependent oxidoreductase